MKEAFVSKLETQLTEWESNIASLATRADRDVHALVDDWKVKRDAAVKKLDELKSEGSDRWDVLKMGVESAWDELRTAFETATAKNPNQTETKTDHPSS